MSTASLPLLQTDVIPQPPRLPLLGHAHHFMGADFVQGLMKLARQYGPLFELHLPGNRVLVATDYALAEELCDEKRFGKRVGGPLKHVRRFTGDGLFTAMNDEANWAKAHQILMPAFSMKAIRGYFPGMLEMGKKLVEKWSNHDPAGVEVAEDFTRLTLDTIALCGFDYRFNSFDSDELHPFVNAMNRCLADCRRQMRSTPVQRLLNFKGRRQFTLDRDLMFRIVDDVIAERLADPRPGQKDLMGLMLDGVDRKTGTGLDAENIRYQLITFLIAGHETTSGWLSFALYFLVKNPEIMAKAVAEVDHVFADANQMDPTFVDVQKLTYLDQILKESLRLWPTAPAFSRTPHSTTTLGGKYRVRLGDRVLVFTPIVHRDPRIWGPEPEVFNPDHFAPEACKKRPEKAYRPFGTGMRVCIGQHFATVEATLALALLLKNFEFEDFENYKLKIIENLTLKPQGFRLRIHPRRAQFQKAMEAARG
ncbi:MAG TPA: cytochrome P450 [Oligoflexus sp.]|uniref:cytochrome P450 n=1 Tax=Oligoflexus sp. TaxID=1971216 RepID=UPI002D3ACB4C|nr:cytochrome P450 [Oligoflexus sp.]HYX35535.1 cytochrome P450 [Oligoflexus sp.]